MYKQLILLLTIFSFVSKSFAVWSQSGTDIDGEESGDQAQSVALSADGTTLAIGAPGHDSNKGQVRVYKWNETAWSQSGDIDGKKAGDYAGGSVALSADGTTLAIGAPGHYSNKGHVRMYKWNETAWSPSGNIDGVKAGDSAGDWSTVALSADGTTLAIGAPYHDSNKGHVRVYKNEAVCLQEYCSKKCLVTLVDSSCATQAYVNQEINETYGDCTFFDSEVPTPYDLAYELETYRPEIKQADCPKFQCPDGYTKETGDGTTCIGERSGCTDGTATNYDITATIDDYSCFYGAEDPSTSDDIDGDGIRNENDWDADGDGSIDEFEDGDGIDDDEMYDEVLDPDDMYDDAGYPIFGDDIYGVEEYTYLGSSVALSGDGETLAIGACCGHSYKGNVRVYKWNVTDWSKSVDIDGVEDWDRTGSSVALSEDGDTLAVGEPGHMGSKGRVRIYTRNGTVWSKSGRDIDGVPSSVSLSGDGQTLAIGARGYDERKGRVRIYTWNGTVWSQSVDIDGVEDWAELGSSVSLSRDGQTLAAAAAGAAAAKVRVYTQNGGWFQSGNTIPYIYADTTFDGVDQTFDMSVALSANGATLAVGTPDLNSYKGQVRIYKWDNNALWLKAGDNIDGVENFDELGKSVALSEDGDTLAIGVKGYDESKDRRRKGRVRIYTWNGTVWSQSVDIDGVDNYAELGSSVSFSANGSTLAVGAPGHDYSKGRVRVYKIEEIMEQRAAELADDGSAEDAATSTKEVYLGLCLENVSLVCVETCHHASLSTDHTLDSGTLDSGWFDWDSLNTYMVCKKACDDGSGDHDSCQIMENHPYFVCLSGDSDICAEMCEKYTNTNDYVNAIFEDLCGAPPSPAPAPPPPSPEPADDDATSDDIDGDATSDISACENGHIHSVYSCISACEKGDIHSCLLAVKRYPQTINDIFDLLAANTGSTADQLAADEAHSCVNGSNPDDLREAYNSLQLC